MASISLNFRPPTEPGIDLLHIYEAPASAGPWTLIETVDLSPTYPYPDYLTRYTTSLATSENSWFSIEWEDSKGARSGMSAPIQGGTENLVSVLTERVILRDSSLAENVAAQEAETVIEEFFPGRVVREVQPEEATFKMLSGMTLIVMARTYIQTLLSGASTSEDFTAGLVSMKSSSGVKRDLKTIMDLLKTANTILGLSYSVKLLMEEAVIGGKYRQLHGVDLTRLLLEID
jgi:hypothetical protein